MPPVASTSAVGSPDGPRRGPLAKLMASETTSAALPLAAGSAPPTLRGLQRSESCPTPQQAGDNAGDATPPVIMGDTLAAFGLDDLVDDMNAAISNARACMATNTGSTANSTVNEALDTLLATIELARIDQRGAHGAPKSPSVDKRVQPISSGVRSPSLTPPRSGSSFGLNGSTTAMFNPVGGTFMDVMQRSPTAPSASPRNLSPSSSRPGSSMLAPFPDPMARPTAGTGGANSTSRAPQAPSSSSSARSGTSSGGSDLTGGAYRVVKNIGEGSFGQVKLAVHVDSGEKVAIKSIDRLVTARSTNTKRMILGEITALLTMDVAHPRICPLIDVFATSTSIFLAFPLVSGGDLFEWLKSIPGNRPSTLADARTIFKQIVSAVQYCHEQGFCHRDLKLENILHVRNPGTQAHEPGQIRLIDFGFATVISENPLHTHFLGSGTYASPEMGQQIPYSGSDVDVWSLGVILYVLITGKFPFRGDTPRELAQRISAGVPVLNSTRFQGDPNLIDIVRRCLEVDRTKRATVAQLLAHPWLAEGGDETLRGKSRAVLAAEYAPAAGSAAATVAAMFPGPLFAGIYLKHGSKVTAAVGPNEVASAPAVTNVTGGKLVSASTTSVSSAT
ncbi:hypothetical protein GGF31_001823 [Allomyces arbusculus]|nr:hypothetical protein GGF31_001823 [Allomyces arbusculus]